MRLIHLQSLKKLQKQLKHNVRANRPMTIDDLKLQIETTLNTTERNFKMGESRISAVLFPLLLAPQGSRPQSILNLQLKHIKLLLIRDPESSSGRPRLTINLTLGYTKTYLGPKAT